ncbi:hypothetical protein [Acetobacter cerevisiae]|uniref:Uncharacterized protein n=1 Tax=Acetobacter cerevisiae TaxID=178900 RepID=A0A149QPT5_9PROT|nr:hypothetical protein [Acetobacter cerevisiae]KXU99136.1 hypothetical protein AD928_02720 [Acetobacter cerevisiae]GBQ08870.1 hypothetical protein AA14362_2072 [Acetobacter cerevisiae DSM 14362]
MSASLASPKTFLEDVEWTWGPLNLSPLTTSLRFGSDGLIKGYEHANEHFWTLKDDVLEIYATDGRCMWRFEQALDSGNTLTFISYPQQDPLWNVFFGLSALKADITTVIESNGHPLDL